MIHMDKLKVAKAIGSLPENVNFGIKASTVRQFLTSSGLPSKKSERTEEKSTEQLAEIAKNQALMVMCLQEEGSGSKKQREGSGGMSQDIMDHIYKTSEEAKRASEMLGFGGEIHSHETPQGIIFMPGPTM